MRRVLRDADGHTYVEVAFGTSNARSYSGLDLYVANLVDMNEMGLPQATVFQLGRTRLLPWSKEWFTVREDCKTPIIGHLNERMVEYLNLLLRQQRR
ncbi:MAG: hypothetical protein WD341_14120 [Tistlia sp.]|uniref:hypothetical protein n=1 Tax=Tistlia sp. TaxID=3057121 RepID=UPI0034A36750